jgi:acyl carrier protein
VGGDGVTRGYLGRPALTAERYVPDPFSAEPGARMYRTGDLARHVSDGKLEFLGRADEQVKVRGFRVELGEIESALRSHAAVSEAVVVLREFEAGGDQQLVAYVVAADKDSGVSGGDLREHLREMLPDYMLPAQLVTLDSLPLTPNGKVDRRALPEPGEVRPALREAYVAPRNPVEEVVAAIWAEVLRLDRVGVDDDFFELGGHSMLTMLVSSRIRDAFQIELQPSAVFDLNTVAKVSASLVAQEAAPGQVEKMAALLIELEAMSDEEASETLQQMGGAEHE